MLGFYSCLLFEPWLMWPAGTMLLFVGLIDFWWNYDLYFGTTATRRSATAGIDTAAAWMNPALEGMDAAAEATNAAVEGTVAAAERAAAGAERRVARPESAKGVTGVIPVTTRPSQTQGVPPDETLSRPKGSTPRK